MNKSNKSNGKKNGKIKVQDIESSMIIVTVMIVLLFGVFFGFGYAVGGCSMINYVKDIENNGTSGELMELKR